MQDFSKRRREEEEEEQEEEEEEDTELDSDQSLRLSSQDKP